MTANYPIKQGRTMVGLRDSGEPLATKYDLALVDLDGVVRRGNNPITHASESLNRAAELGLKQVFVTNNASITPAQVAAQLTNLGITNTSAQHVMTAALSAAALLLTKLSPGDKVLVVGGEGLLEACQQAGFTVIPATEPHAADAQPKAVVMGYAPTVAWPQLAEAAYAVNQGAWFVASNLDKSLPTARGFAPGNGALVAAVQAATGRAPESDGKPSPAMYQLAVAAENAINPLVIGDRLDTDLGGASAAHYPGLMVLTGVSSARDAVLAPPSCRPDYLGADLRTIFEVHHAPHEGPDNWWISGDRGARISNHRLELDGQGAFGIDVIRAACAAAWNAADHGIAVQPDSVPDFTV